MADTADTERTEIGDAENRRYAAMTRADVGELAELLSDQLVYTHSNGVRDTKASYLQAVSDGIFQYGPIDHPQSDVYVAGGCVVVNGHMHCPAVVHGVEKVLNSACIAVWSRESGRWQLVAFQGTPIPA
jgi:ketosteroid isomerase-like protein